MYLLIPPSNFTTRVCFLCPSMRFSSGYSVCYRNTETRQRGSDRFHSFDASRRRPPPSRSNSLHLPPCSHLEMCPLRLTVHSDKCYSRVVVLARLVVSRRTGTSYSAYTSSFTLFTPYMVVSRHPRGTLFSSLTSPICLQVHRTLFLAEISRRHHRRPKYLHVQETA